MNDDFRIREFKNNLVNTINAEPLPLEVKRLVLTDILHEVATAADNSIRSYLMSEKENSDSENSPE